MNGRTLRQVLVTGLAAALSITALPAQATNTISVSLSTSNGTYSYSVSPSETVAQFRDGSLADAGFSVYQHKLTLNGKNLDDKAKLSVAGVTDGSTLDVGRAFAPLTVSTTTWGGACPGSTTIKNASNVYFDWNNSNTVAGCRAEWVQLAISGYIAMKDSGTQTLCIDSDDGNQMSIDGNLVISDWNDSGGGWDCADVWFDAGVARAIKVDYYQAGGLRHLFLKFGSHVVVPAENFNSTPNFLFDNPNVINHYGLDWTNSGVSINAQGKATISAWLASNPNANSITLVGSDYQGTPSVGNSMLRHARTAFQKAGYTGTIKLIYRNAFSGNGPGDLQIQIVDNTVGLG